MTPSSVRFARLAPLMLAGCLLASCSVTRSSPPPAGRGPTQSSRAPSYAGSGKGHFSPLPFRGPAALFTNGGFEGGDLGSWTLQTFTNPGINYPPATVADLNLGGGGRNASSAVGPAAANSQVPYGLSAGASLLYPAFGSYSAVVNQGGNGQNVNLLTQTFQSTSADVDPSDGKIHVRFVIAPVLQNPGHPTNAQPYFWVDVVNTTSNQTLFHSFNFANQPGVPWQTDPGSGDLYTSWQLVDVAPGTSGINIGDSIQVDVYGAGCAYGGHFGEVYVDAFGAFIPGMTVAAHALQQANAGDNLTYTYLVTNGSALPQANATVTAVLPDNTTFVSVNAPGATCTTPAVGAAGTVVCNLGSVNASASSSFQLTVLIPSTVAGGSVISHGNYSVQSDGTQALLGPLVTTNVTTGALYTDLAASMSDGTAALTWGQAVQYTLTVANQGANPVTGAPVQDTLPAQLTGATWTCTTSSGGACGLASGTGDINTTVDLPAGATATFVLSANVVAGSGNATMSNSATVTTPSGITDSDTTNNTATVVNSIGQVDVLTVQNTGMGPGSIVSSPASLNCGPTCASQSGSFADGSQVTLTATAVGNAVFLGWTGGGCSGTTNSCTLTMSGPTTVSASFGYPVTTSVTGGNGTLTCSSPVAAGASDTCTLTPAPGYQVAGLTDNGTDVTASISGGVYTLTNVSASHTLIATFSLANGSACSGAGSCGSGFCVDGVCCNSACTGECQSCGLPESAGTCTLVTGAPQGGRQACANNAAACGGTCDGTSPSCAYPSTTVQCTGPSCANGTATLAATCDGAGSCQPAQTQTCPLNLCQGAACANGCTTDANCPSSTWCAGGVCVPQKPVAGTCSANDQCASGACVDGVCCNKACNGQCESCGLPGSVGTCSAVTGAPVGARPACTTDGSACGGTCNGDNTASCSYPSASLACRGAACSSGTETLPASCNGAGTCGGVQTESCGAYACGGTTCKTSCAKDADCASADFCSAGSCVPKKPSGGSCGSTDQCQSGFCTDGVCCNSACDGQCEACDNVGSVGTCTASDGEPHGARPTCHNDGSSCGGACDGKNPVSCGFTSPKTVCRPASCSGGVETRVASCDGAGSCPAMETHACGDYTCGANACNTECTSDTQCVASAYCRSGTCAPRGNNGAWTAKGSGCSAGGGEFGWLVVAAVAFTLLRRRREVRVLGLALVVLGGAARAQSNGGVSLAFTADRFQPEGGAYDILGVESAKVARPWEFTGFVMGDYANQPLRLVSTTNSNDQVTLLQHQTTLNVGASVGLFGFAELSVVLPATVSQSSRDGSIVSPLLAGGVSSSGVGDLRLTPKVRLVDVPGFALGVAVPISLPTGNSNAYLGEGSVTAGGRLLVDVGDVHGLRFSGNAGFLFQPDHQFVQVHVTKSFQYGAAVEVPLVSPDSGVTAIASLVGQRDVGYPGAAQAPLEGLAGLRWHTPWGLGLSAGGGPGLTSGYGTPRYRAFAGISWEGTTYAVPPRARIEPLPAPLPAAPACPSCPVCPEPPKVVAKVEPPPPAPAAPAPPAEEPKGLTRVEAKQIVLLKPVVFASGSAKLDPASFAVLDDAAKTLNENPQIGSVRIEGHTDNRGVPAVNLRLSKRRAESVRKYLVAHGVSAQRLSAQGFGDTRPLDTEDSEAARLRNRRVEFSIVGAPAPAP